MSVVLIVHISAGIAAVLSGVAALCVRKGARWHRMFGTVFFISMLVLASLGAYLALFLPQIATAIVGVLTCYLVATGWVAARKTSGAISKFDKIAVAIPVCVTAALLYFGVQALHSPTGLLQGAPPAPYFVFAFFAAFTSALDLKMIRRGSISGRQRIMRHLWRMCFALFFAIFSFLGQQKVLPAAIQNSAFLIVPAIAPLIVMFYWLVRVRFTAWLNKTPWGETR